MLPDHPEIEMAMRTGYPSWNQPKRRHVYCENCGEDITDKDVYYDENHKYICKECLLFFHLKWY